MNSCAARHHDVHVLRPVGDADVIGIASLCEPPLTPVMQAFDRARRKAAERDAATLEYRLCDLPFADPIPRQRSGMLGANVQQRTGRKDDVVMAKPGHGADELIEDLRAGLAA